MAKYEVNWRYASSLAGPFQAGDVVELEAEVAEVVNRDSPGVLVPVGERAVEGKSDRMQKPKSRRKE